VPTALQQARGGDANAVFLMIEGDAIDWAGRANQCGRLIEEDPARGRHVEAAALGKVGFDLLG
jgi:alkaline phosphatase